MKPYEKTPTDDAREKSDLKENPIMRWLQNQDIFRFNVGDVLVKKVLHRSYAPHNVHTDTWETELVNSANSVPKKYVYAFENMLGIGYIRQLKVDGSGYCGTLICVANFDPTNTRFELDPDFVDHQLIGEGDFQYNQEYANKRQFRQEAMEANKNIMIKTSSKKGLKEWFLGLKIGDEFWYGQTFDELEKCQFRVTDIKKSQKPSFSTRSTSYPYSKAELANENYLDTKEWCTIEAKVVKGQPWQTPGLKKQFRIGDFSWAKVTTAQPFPMKDPLCAPAK